MAHGLFAPVYHGKIVRKKPMASRQVIEHTCDRCTRTWYTDATKPEVKVELKLSWSIGALSTTFDCLCDGCTQTVGTLVMQIAKVMKKSAPVRGAKKKVEEEAKASSTTQSTTSPSVANDLAKSAPAPAHAASGHAPIPAPAPHRPTK